jgi:hypothetical protein
MGDDPDALPPSNPNPARSGSGVILALVALALILAIGFFYLTNDRRGDGRADKVTRAADSADQMVIGVGDAARDAAHDLRNHN